MLLIAALLFLGTTKHFTVELKSRHTQEHLIEIVNLLQHSHAQLLEQSHYQKVGKGVEGALQFEMVMLEKNIQKKNLKHQNHHNKKQEHHHKKRKSTNMVVNESLMDVIPLTAEEKSIFEESGALAPVDVHIEQQMEHQSQKLLTTNRNQDGLYIADVPLTNIANTMFIGELQVGSAQGKNSFDVIFDTGSALTCVASEQCKDIGCYT